MKKSNFFALFSIFLLNFIFLFIAINNLSISIYEAEIFFNENSLIAIISRFFCEIFGNNDFALRIPLLFIHFANLILLYFVSKNITKTDFEALICVGIYSITPGVIVSAILLNNAVLCIFFTLFIIFCEQKNYKILQIILLLIALFIFQNFSTFFLAFFFYKIYQKNQKEAFFILVLFIISLFFNNISINGKPKGYFLDTIGVFAAVFSPFFFIYFIYTIYRICIKGDKNLIWFIGFVSFCFCAILSFRQRLELEEFLPFCVICVPLMVKTFFTSYRRRLLIFRKKYKILAVFVIVTLLLNSSAIIFHQFFYNFISPKKHFAYKYDVAKDLAKFLNKNNIEISTCDEDIKLRLKFYGVKFSPFGKTLTLSKEISNSQDFVYKKFNKIIAIYTIK